MSKISWHVLGYHGYSFQLGYIIPNRERLSHVVNEENPLPIPTDLPTYTSTVVEYVKKKTGGNPKSGQADDGIPVGTAAAVAMNTDPQIIRLPPSPQIMRVKALETHIIQPTPAYVEASVAACLGRSMLLRVPKRTVYMVTGLMIAPGATAGIFNYVQDFVWAIGLTKLSRGLFGLWTQEECSDGLMFIRESIGVYRETFGDERHDTGKDRLVTLRLVGKHLVALT